ncbi:MAG: N-acetylmuramic acid 6-phosphate etherase [Candidatus Hydrogenedentes bacterium]|nr:N-acetylmuramic acid 6-phosphate etherase [Candidatus Hydrogenedentota bacterium]
MSCILAIDGGGSRTRAGLYTPAGQLLAETEGEGSNPLEVGEEFSASTVSELAGTLASDTGKQIGRIVAGIAGAGILGKAEKLANRIAWCTKVDNVAVTSDLLMMYYANCTAEAPILATAGTGSSVAARSRSGRPVIAGGLGPVVDDDGSAYRIAIQAIKYAEDDQSLLTRLLEHSELEHHAEFVWWSRITLRVAVADLARPVFSLANEGNKVALACVQDEAAALARQVIRALRKAELCEEAAETTLTVLTHGGVFQNSTSFRDAFAKSLTATYSRLTTKMVSVKGHAAAVQLAMGEDLPQEVALNSESAVQDIPETEQAESSYSLDDMDDDDMLLAMDEADSDAQMSVHFAEGSVLRAINAAADCLRASGRIIYVGAGTSGRLGVLDASECPPTFGVSEDRIVALIAGGDEALRHSIEGAEDDEDQAVRDLEALDPPPVQNDIVIGITASGTTPYVLAALEKAQDLGAKTAIICCNPVPLDTADIIVALDTGPEILPGSTRLKAGTATKMVLNQISTGAMAKAGYVFEGRMIGVRPVNAKLRQRCIRIVSELTGKPTEESERLLDEAEGSIPVAIIMERTSVDAEEARNRLDAARGNLRAALEAS